MWVSLFVLLQSLTTTVPSCQVQRTLHREIPNQHFHLFSVSFCNMSRQKEGSTSSLEPWSHSAQGSQDKTGISATHLLSFLCSPLWQVKCTHFTTSLSQKDKFAAILSPFCQPCFLIPFALILYQFWLTTSQHFKNLITSGYRRRLVFSKASTAFSTRSLNYYCMNHRNKKSSVNSLTIHKVQTSKQNSFILYVPKHILNYIFLL